MRHGPSLRGLGMLSVKWQLATHPGAVCKARERVAPARRVNRVSSASERSVRYWFGDVDGQLITDEHRCVRASRFALNLYVKEKDLSQGERANCGLDDRQHVLLEPQVLGKPRLVARRRMWEGKIPQRQVILRCFHGLGQRRLAPTT